MTISCKRHSWRSWTPWGRGTGMRRCSSLGTRFGSKARSQRLWGFGRQGNEMTRSVEPFPWTRRWDMMKQIRSRSWTSWKTPRRSGQCKVLWSGICHRAFTDASPPSGSTGRNAAAGGVLVHGFGFTVPQAAARLQLDAATVRSAADSGLRLLRRPANARQLLGLRT